MSWFEVVMEVSDDAADTDAVVDRLQELGAVSVTIRGAGDDLVVEPAPGHTPLWRRNRLEALFPLDTDLAQLRRSFANFLDADTLVSLDVGFVDEVDWLQAWRAHAVQHLFGDRLWVAPKDAQMPENSLVVRLEPGLAFGTGGHPTTKLCLDWLARWPLEGLRVMDYGCGSGILSVAACLLGTAQAYAVDHDPQALLATRENATYNGVSAEQLTVLAPDELTMPIEFDVVLANILAKPLVELAPRLFAMTRPGGKLILSGLLADQAEWVMAAYPGVAFEEFVREGSWIRLVGTRRLNVR